MSLSRRSGVRLHLRTCISAAASFPRSHGVFTSISRGPFPEERRTRVERTTWAHLITQRWSAMRVLTSFSLLGGTARCAHNAHELYAATVKPGRISRRRNLNSWKREREETGCTRVCAAGTRKRRNGEIREEKKRRRKRLGISVRSLYKDNADKS